MKLTRRVLHNRIKPVDFRLVWQNQRLAGDMLEFMRRNNGIGLAANQIGVARRLFVMEINGWRRICFNPEILECSPDLVSWNEACLSFPGDQYIIQRPQWVDVRYQSADGVYHTERLADLLGRCFQHELDHLNGVTMWDRHEEQHAKQS